MSSISTLSSPILWRFSLFGWICYISCLCVRFASFFFIFLWIFIIFLRQIVCHLLEIHFHAAEKLKCEMHLWCWDRYSLKLLKEWFQVQFQNFPHSGASIRGHVKTSNCWHRIPMTLSHSRITHDTNNGQDFLKWEIKCEVKVKI